MSQTPLIRIIDDDPTVSESLSFVLEVAGFTVKAYANPSDFLALDDFSRTGALLLDVRMPAMTGLELQNRMKHDQIDLPIVFLSAHGDIEMAVEAVHNGAVDFLVKPPKPEKLIAVLEKACRECEAREALKAELADMESEFARLTPAEQETAFFLAKGLSSREIASLLNVSDETVRSRRSTVYKKLELRGSVEVAQFLARRDNLRRTVGRSGLQA